MNLYFSSASLYSHPLKGGSPAISNKMPIQKPDVFTPVQAQTRFGATVVEHKGTFRGEPGEVYNHGLKASGFIYLDNNVVKGGLEAGKGVSATNGSVIEDKIIARRQVTLEDKSEAKKGVTILEDSLDLNGGIVRGNVEFVAKNAHTHWSEGKVYGDVQIKDQMGKGKLLRADASEIYGTITVVSDGIEPDTTLYTNGGDYSESGNIREGSGVFFGDESGFMGGKSSHGQTVIRKGGRTIIGARNYVEGNQDRRKGVFITGDSTVTGPVIGVIQGGTTHFPGNTGNVEPDYQQPVLDLRNSRVRGDVVFDENNPGLVLVSRRQDVGDVENGRIQIA